MNEENPRMLAEMAEKIKESLKEISEQETRQALWTMKNNKAVVSMYE